MVPLNQKRLIDITESYLTRTNKSKPHFFCDLIEAYNQQGCNSQDNVYFLPPDNLNSAHTRIRRFFSKEDVSRIPMELLPAWITALNEDGQFVIDALLDPLGLVATKRPKLQKPEQTDTDKHWLHQAKNLLNAIINLDKLTTTDRKVLKDDIDELCDDLIRQAMQIKNDAEHLTCAKPHKLRAVS